MLLEEVNREDTVDSLIEVIMILVEITLNLQVPMNKLLIIRWIQMLEVKQNQNIDD